MLFLRRAMLFVLFDSFLCRFFPFFFLPAAFSSVASQYSTSVRGFGFAIALMIRWVSSLFLL